MQEPIVFDDITPVEVPVSIGGQSYVLREASGEAAVRHTNLRTRCTKFVDGKFAGIDGPIGDLEPQLVADCLFKVNVLADGKPVFSKVEEKLVRSWPARVQKTLYLRAKKISRFDDADEETIETLEKKLVEMKAERDEAKNLPSGTTDGSN